MGSVASALPGITMLAAFPTSMSVPVILVSMVGLVMMMSIASSANALLGILGIDVN